MEYQLVILLDLTLMIHLQPTQPFPLQFDDITVSTPNYPIWSSFDMWYNVSVSTRQRLCTW